MFKYEEKTIYVTRGDQGSFTVAADLNAGDVVRFKVTRKKDCEKVVCQRDFQVSAKTNSIEIVLDSEATRIGEVISKPTDYWYEVELNPDTDPKTIIGYDEDGAKVLRLFPEGADVNPEDIEVVGKKTLQDLVDYALLEAKESGEFDGKDGYTPIKGVDYFDGKDGYTPQKGVDYFDGAKGDKGDKGDKGEKGDSGPGSGDMLASMYDPQGRKTDIFKALSDHETRRDNPHGVTAEQTGAAPLSHVSNSNNPHGVTIEQIGAAPASHVNDKNNPHGVTIAQIGAAPAGYGLGSVAGADKWNGDANALTKQGWYRLESGTTNGVGESASVRVDGYAETGLTQTAYTRTGFVLQRTCVDGTWGEWEYVNPPVQPGVEYRTTERWYGSSVYTKLVYCGRLATGRNVIAHNLGCEIIRCVGTCDRNGLPYADKDYNGDIGLAVSQNNIVINATSQFNNKVAHVQLWYVK